ncbi:hypothetical protein O4H25_14625, partial [Staphylococcus equorum]|uniref:hypothetical protein n=1 Tax=Staphylococcus equorum TaxID=246432 RepID=UPI0022B04F3B
CTFLGIFFREFAKIKQRQNLIFYVFRGKMSEFPGNFARARKSEKHEKMTKILAFASQTEF